MESAQKVLELATLAGVALLKNGAEIFRVQETMSRILYAYGLEDFHVYVLSNGIFATVNEGKDDQCSVVRNIPVSNIYLSRIADVNKVSRDICSHRCTFEEAYAILQEYQKPPQTNFLLSSIFCGFGCMGFCMVFGGSFTDALNAWPIGALLNVLLHVMGKHGLSKFVTNILGSAFVTFLAILSTLTLHTSLNMVVIGTIMPLVPGVALTTSIREIFNSDYLSGSIHMIDALLTAICIAIGVGAAIFAMQNTIGGLVL